MALEVFGIYLALAALFYLRLAASAAVAVPLAHSHRTHWQRARTVKNKAFRRLRPLMALRLPKRPR